MIVSVRLAEIHPQFGITVFMYLARVRNLEERHGTFMWLRDLPLRCMDSEEGHSLAQ